MLTRREFLIGFGAGLILPNWVLKAEQFIENEGRALLELPAVANDTLTALGNDLGYTLYLNDEQDVPRLTWREMIDRYQLTNGEPLDDYDWTLRQWGYNDNLDEEVSESIVFDFWLEREGPSVQAYQLLENLPLDNAELDGQLYGGLTFTHGFHPGDWTPHVIADDQLTLSLLQRKFNDLGMAIRVVEHYV
jgi:hypothetical protein